MTQNNLTGDAAAAEVLKGMLQGEEAKMRATALDSMRGFVAQGGEITPELKAMMDHNFPGMSDELSASQSGDSESGDSEFEALMNDTLADGSDALVFTGESIGEQSGETEKASQTALKLDNWSIRRGTEFLNDVRPDAYADSTTDELERARNTAADMFSAAFEVEPELAERCTDETRHRFMENLLETPEYHALHADTRLDEVASELAAMKFMEEYEILVEEEKNQKQNQKQNQEPGKPGSDPSMNAMKAVAKALNGAKKDVDDLRDAQNALGLGGDGTSEGRLDRDKMLELFKRIRGSRQLKRIFDLAGKFRRMAQAQQKQKTEHGYDDVVDTELDGDVGRLVPSELALLGDEDLELDVMRRIVERQALCRRFEGAEKKAKGPVIVTVDTSGSMSGEPVANAKAIALSMFWIARQQKRAFVAIDFSGKDAEGYAFAWAPGKKSYSLEDWLCHFYGGGTSPHVPLDRLPNVFWPMLQKECPEAAQDGKTDFICITDGQLNVPDGMRDDFNAWKADHQVKMKCIVIGNSGESLKEVADEIYSTGKLSLDSDGVKEAFSV